MDINFDSIEPELLLEDNLNTLISAMEFFIAIEYKGKKEHENDSADLIIEKLEDNIFSFDLYETTFMVKVLENLKMNILEDFEPPSNIRLSNVEKLLQLLEDVLDANGFDYKTRLVKPT